eukprot:761261-Pyramimonas_sp.AAC.1
MGPLETRAGAITIIESKHLSPDTSMLGPTHGQLGVPRLTFFDRREMVRNNPSIQRANPKRLEYSKPLGPEAPTGAYQGGRRTRHGRGAH